MFFFNIIVHCNTTLFFLNKQCSFFFFYFLLIKNPKKKKKKHSSPKSGFNIDNKSYYYDFWRSRDNGVMMLKIQR